MNIDNAIAIGRRDHMLGPAGVAALIAEIERLRALVGDSPVDKEPKPRETADENPA